MTVISLRKTYTFVFVFALFVLFSFQKKNSESFLISDDNDPFLTNLMAVKDTSNLYYYSFEDHKTVKFEEFLEEASSSLITACNGGNLVLSAPDYGKDAKYEWFGPNGLSILGSEISFQKIAKINSGLYSIVVTKGDLTIYGRIKVEVKDMPIVKIKETQFYEGQKIHLEALSVGKRLSYTWKNSEQKIVSNSANLWLPAHHKGEYVYTLLLDKNGCKVSHQVGIQVNAKDNKSPYKSVVGALRNVQ